MHFKTFNFPAGESHCEFLNLGGTGQLVYIPFEKQANEWFMDCMMACDVAKRKFKRSFALFLPYLPYSRQDRVDNENYPFSLQVIAKMLNAMEIPEIYTLDAHSDVPMAIINNLINIPQAFILDFMRKNICFGGSFFNKTLVVPDQGAFKKAKYHSSLFNGSVIVVKDRDIHTGRLKIVHIAGDVKGKDLMIVDDICDGGATFTDLAEQLKWNGAKSVDLLVTHGIFSKGFTALTDAGIDNIYCTDSVQHIEFDFIYNQGKVFDVEEILNEYIALNRRL